MNSVLDNTSMRLSGASQMYLIRPDAVHRLTRLSFLVLKLVNILLDRCIQHGILTCR